MPVTVTQNTMNVYTSGVHISSDKQTYKPDSVTCLRDVVCHFRLLPPLTPPLVVR